MRILHRKLWRELWHMRGQALAICLVLAGGAGVCVMSVSTYYSLQQARDDYYRDYRFADVFASLKRAPRTLLRQVRNIPDVAQVQARVVARANLRVAGFDEPIQGLITSIPEHHATSLNRLHLRRGRLPDSRRDDEVLVSDGFAAAHRLQPGEADPTFILHPPIPISR